MALLLCFCASVVIVLPFFWLGTASGHDFEFHAASWMDVASQWREGIFYPHWTKWTNHGFGEPRFIFYPPFSWMLGAGLSFLVRWSYVPVAFLILSQTFAGLAAFALIRRFVCGKYAIFGAVCYAANPNALLMVYMRSDFAELLACAFFPLVVLASLELAGLLQTRRKFQHGATVFFATSFATVWLSNAPAGVIASYSAAGLFIWAAITHRSWRPLLRGAVALGLGLGLAAFYLVPAAYEQKWVSIGQALSEGLLPTENFLYTKIPDAEHTAFNGIASTIAVLLVIVTGLAATAVRAGKKTSAENSAMQKCWSALAIVAGGAALLMFRFTNIFWEYLPKLRFVQFPWRFMSVVSVSFACFVAAAAARRVGWLWMTAVLVLLSMTGVFLVKHTWWDAEDMATMQAAVDHGGGFDGTDEYDPQGDDHYNLPRKAPLALILPVEGERSPGRDVRVQIPLWTTGEKRLRVVSREPVRLALRVLNYPAWQVEVNGQLIQPESADDYGQMIIPLDAGDSRIEVRFTRTPDRTLGLMFSLISLLVVVTLYWTGRYRDG
ncbi:MAG: hypothetical protein PVS2B2_06910 [Candidatus Acidiferrum sp.]